MGDFLAILAILAAFAGVLGLLAWLASLARRRRVGGSVLGVVDEAFRPTSHETRIEIQVQNERMIAAPSPGDR
ncbi:hypothetical protein F4553_002165 [Allocatelliglobosispora scoriae]|uniref:Uncharacterized protein n=1 Tax=Allocatelliglobosispora scoriae TaxID=643052 RepID=A0A841BNC2_9ACTN|nr:hypothetical protein [Allocatelliglobosispora scoriae]MBB5868786.1 hypothetical protein [Allocatelliglobosispora scoriae]